MTAEAIHQQRFPVVFLGSFGWARGPCALCKEMGGRSAWLCAGQLLSVHLCHRHQAEVPVGNLMVEGLFGVVGGTASHPVQLRGTSRLYATSGEHRCRQGLGGS